MLFSCLILVHYLENLVLQYHVFLLNTRRIPWRKNIKVSLGTVSCKSIDWLMNAIVLLCKENNRSSVVNLIFMVDV